MKPAIGLVFNHSWCKYPCFSKKEKKKKKVSSCRTSVWERLGTT